MASDAQLPSNESALVDRLMHAPFATAAMRREAAETIARLMVERDDAKADYARVHRDYMNYRYGGSPPGTPPGRLADETPAHETGEPRAPSGHVGGCMCSPCREWRLVQYANTQKALEQKPLTTVCQWEPIEEGSRCYNTCRPGEEFNLDDGCEPYPFCHWCGRPIVIP